MRRELLRVRAIMESNSDALHSLKKDIQDNLRRCGELQAEVDRLKKMVADR